MADSRSAYERQIMGARKYKLIRELALGNKSQKQLSDEFQTTEATVSRFKKRHAAAIQAIIDDLDNEYAGLSIADQRNRIIEYQAIDDYITELIYSSSHLDNALVNLILRKHQGLRNVAEERGHLSQKVETSGDVRVVLEGVDTEGI